MGTLGDPSHPKRGKPDNQLSSYRPISIVSLISKVIMLVLLARLAPMAEDTVGDYPQHHRRNLHLPSTLREIQTVPSRTAPHLLHRPHPGLRHGELVAPMAHPAHQRYHVEYHHRYQEPLHHSKMRVSTATDEDDLGAFTPTAQAFTKDASSHSPSSSSSSTTSSEGQK